MANGTLDTGVDKACGADARVRAKDQVFSYKAALLAADLTTVSAAAVLCLWGLGYSALFGRDPFQQAVFFAACLAPLAFFLNFRLYSHHLIYSPRYHLTRLGAACGLGLLTIGAVGVLCRWSELVPSGLLIPAVIGLALLFVVVDRMMASRFIEENLLALVKVLGLAFLAVGFIAIIGPVEESLIVLHLEKLFIGVLTASAGLVLTRLVMVHLVFNRLLRRYFRRQVLLVGMNEDAEGITNRIIRRRAPFWIAGTISPQPGDQLSSQVPKSNLGRVQDLDCLLGEHFFHDIIVTDETIPKGELIRLLDLFTSRGIDAWFSPKLMPIISVKLNIDDLCGMPMIRLNSVRHLWLLQKVKHAFDAVAVLVGFVFLWPVFAAFALAIRN
ncbi:MAG: hypothetical protein EHM15_01410, partial [Desulfobacteraceae bacterium]